MSKKQDNKDKEVNNGQRINNGKPENFREESSNGVIRERFHDTVTDTVEPPKRPLKKE